MVLRLTTISILNESIGRLVYEMSEKCPSIPKAQDVVLKSRFVQNLKIFSFKESKKISLERQFSPFDYRNGWCLI